MMKSVKSVGRLESAVKVSELRHVRYYRLERSKRTCYRTDVSVTPTVIIIDNRNTEQETRVSTQKAAGINATTRQADIQRSDCVLKHLLSYACIKMKTSGLYSRASLQPDIISVLTIIVTVACK